MRALAFTMKDQGIIIVNDLTADYEQACREIRGAKLKGKVLNQRKAPQGTRLSR